MGATSGAAIEKGDGVWFVVVPQRVGAPLKFLCETLRDAEHFLKVFSKTDHR